MGWDARAYDESFGFVTEHGEPLVRLLDPRPGERVLDLGCGTGRLAAAIAGRGAETVGVDLDAAMIAAARERFPPSARRALAFVRGDGEALEGVAGLEGPFDAVFSNAALHWMTRPDAVLRGVRALLRPGGRLVAELGGRGNVAAIERALRDALAAEGAPLPERAWYFPGAAEYASLLERSGFEPRLLTTFDRPTPLEGGEGGLAAWLRMFAGPWLAGLSAAGVEAAIARAEASLRPSLWRGGVWVADYRRLRVIAVRSEDREAAADGGAS